MTIKTKKRQTKKRQTKKRAARIPTKTLAQIEEALQGWARKQVRAAISAPDGAADVSLTRLAAAAAIGAAIKEASPGSGLADGRFLAAVLKENGNVAKPVIAMTSGGMSKLSDAMNEWADAQHERTRRDLKKFCASHPDHPYVVAWRALLNVMPELEDPVEHGKGKHLDDAVELVSLIEDLCFFWQTSWYEWGPVFDSLDVVEPEDGFTSCL